MNKQEDETTNDFLKTCSRSMRAAREGAGLDMATAAQAMGISKSRLQSLEQGEDEPFANELVTLAHAYGCSVANLIGYVDPYEGVA